MRTACPRCGRAGVVTWAGQVTQGSESVAHLLIRCPDLHWSVRRRDEIEVCVDQWSLVGARHSRRRRRVA